MIGGFKHGYLVGFPTNKVDGSWRIAMGCNEQWVKQDFFFAAVVCFSRNWGKYPLVNQQEAIEHGPVEIVDLPIKNGDFPQLFVCLPRGCYPKSSGLRRTSPLKPCFFCVFWVPESWPMAIFPKGVDRHGQKGEVANWKIHHFGIAMNGKW